MAGFLDAIPFVGPILNYLGGQDANQTNEDIASANQYFQARARETQYQVAVEDMKKAGLNPMLAYSQGGAGNLQGSTAHVENAMAPAVNAAYAGAQTKATVDNLQEQNKLIQAQTTQALSAADKNVADAKLSTAQAVTEAERPTNVKQATAESVQRIVQSLAQTDRFAEQNNLTRAQARAELQRAETDRARMFLYETENRLRAKEEPRITNEMMAQDSAFMRNVAPYSRYVRDGVSAVQGLRQLFRPNFQLRRP